MSNFFRLGEKWVTPAQMRKHIEEQKRLSEIFCEWCISKGVRHTKECPTRLEGFDEKVTPVLTKGERESLIKQKNEALNKR